MRNAIRTFAYTLLFYCYLARLRWSLWTTLGALPNIIASFSYEHPESKCPRGHGAGREDPDL